MKKSGWLLALTFMLVSCHESIEDKAVREAREYTRKYCPTPTSDYARTDSVRFDKPTRTYHYYCTLSGRLDNPALMQAHRHEFHERIKQEIRQSTGIKAYKDAGFAFAYTCRSERNPKLVLYQDTFTSQDYNE